MADPVDPTVAAPIPEVSAAVPAVVETPAPAAAVELAPAAPIVATPEIPAAEPTLLEKFEQEKAVLEAAKVPKPTEPAKEPGKEAAAADPAKSADETKAPEPPPLAPVEYKYTLPETLKMDDALKGEVHSALDAFRSNPAEGAQKLIDLHAKTMQDYAEQLSRDQHTVFAKTRQDWQKEVMSDAQLGGAGYQTTMGAIARVRDALVPENDRAAFDDFLRITGAGDHPQFLKLLHRAVPYIDEPPQPPPNPKPPTGLGQKPAGKLRDLYKS